MSNNRLIKYPKDRLPGCVLTADIDSPVKTATVHLLPAALQRLAAISSRVVRGAGLFEADAVRED
jgi:hypothetical protein